MCEENYEIVMDDVKEGLATWSGIQRFPQGDISAWGDIVHI